MSVAAISRRSSSPVSLASHTHPHSLTPLTPVIHYRLAHFTMDTCSDTSCLANGPQHIRIETAYRASPIRVTRLLLLRRFFVFDRVLLCAIDPNRGHSKHSPARATGRVGSSRARGESLGTRGMSFTELFHMGDTRGWVLLRRRREIFTAVSRVYPVRI